MRAITVWTTSLILGVLGISIPGSTKAEVAVVGTQSAVVAVSPDRLAEGRAKQVLLDSYKFGEDSRRVAELQAVIGTVRVDGTYGPITRREHIEKLQSLNLPVDNVPTPSASAVYDIPSDQSQRCPQLEPLFQQAGLEPVEVFSYIAYRESHCNPKAQNATWKNGVMTYHLNKDKSYDTGLLQINSSWKSVTEKVCGESSSDNHMDGLKDPMCNIAVAKYIMDNSQGKLGNWRVYKRN